MYFNHWHHGSWIEFYFHLMLALVQFWCKIWCVFIWNMYVCCPFSEAPQMTGDDEADMMKLMGFSGFDSTKVQSSVNSLAPGRCGCNRKLVIFKLISRITWIREHYLWNCLQVNATGPHWWLVNIGSSNGLVPSAGLSLDILKIES